MDDHVVFGPELSVCSFVSVLTFVYHVCTVVPWKVNISVQRELLIPIVFLMLEIHLKGQQDGSVE